MPRASLLTTGNSCSDIRTRVSVQAWQRPGKQPRPSTMPAPRAGQRVCVAALFLALGTALTCLPQVMIQ